MIEECHHIWCNLQKGSPSKCKQCIPLYEKYPMIDGDFNGDELTQKYFPEVICLRKSKVKDRKEKELA